MGVAGQLLAPVYSMAWFAAALLNVGVAIYLAIRLKLSMYQTPAQTIVRNISISLTVLGINTIPGCAKFPPCDNLFNCPGHLEGIKGILVSVRTLVPPRWRSSVGRASVL